MTREEAAQILNRHMVTITGLRTVKDAISIVWEMAVLEPGEASIQPTFRRVRPILDQHIVLCDVGARGNGPANARWRDAASALRWLLAQAEATA